MAEEGTVVAVRPGEVDIVLQGSSACSGCNACAAADGGMLMEHVAVTAVLSVGDRVAVEVKPQATTRARSLVFGLPVALLLAGYLAGYLLGGVLGMAPDTAGAVGAIAGLIAAMAALSAYDRRHSQERSGDVSVHAIISQVTPAGSACSQASSQDQPGLGGQDS